MTLKQVSEVFKIMFYVFGIVAFVVMINTKGNPEKIEKVVQNTQTQITKIIEKPEKTVVEHNYFTPNTLGVLFLGMITLTILSGFLYFFIDLLNKTRKNISKNADKVEKSSLSLKV